MPYTVIMYAYRKKGTSPTAFKQHYENTHVPLLQRLSGKLFPLSHVRHYIGYVPQGEAKPADAMGGYESLGTAVNLADSSSSAWAAGGNVPMVVMGQPSDFEWDVVTIITYENEAHFKQFMGVCMEPENARLLKEDEERFTERERFQAVILGEVMESRNGGYVGNRNF